MEITKNLLFLLAGLVSFLTYRLGIKDGLRLSKEEEPERIFTKVTEGIPEENEKDFYSQYSKLMSYDFDKAGESDE